MRELLDNLVGLLLAFLLALLAVLAFALVLAGPVLYSELARWLLRGLRL